MYVVINFAAHSPLRFPISVIVSLSITLLSYFPTCLSFPSLPSPPLLPPSHHPNPSPPPPPFTPPSPSSLHPTLPSSSPHPPPLLCRSVLARIQSSDNPVELITDMRYNRIPAIEAIIAVFASDIWEYTRASTTAAQPRPLSSTGVAQTATSGPTGFGRTHGTLESTPAIETEVPAAIPVSMGTSGPGDAAKVKLQFREQLRIMEEKLRVKIPPCNARNKM